jgi:hypothetical protein
MSHSTSGTAAFPDFPDPSLFKPSRPTRSDRRHEDRPQRDNLGRLVHPGCPWYEDCSEAAALYNMASLPCDRCPNNTRKKSPG